MRSLPFLALSFLLLAAGAAPTAGIDTTTTDERILQEAKVGTKPDDLLDYFRKRTLPDVEADKMRGLIKKLGDDSFAVREEASNELIKLGMVAEPLLRQAAMEKDIEIVRRAEECLKQMKVGPSAAVDAAALRLLAKQRPAGAAEAVLGWVPFVGSPLLLQEARETLAATAVRDGKLDKGVEAALTASLPQRRAAAAVAICRAGSADQSRSVRALLKDDDRTVRLQTALALAEARDADAMPTLIELLPVLPLSQAWQAEDMLFRIAGAQPPAISFGSEANGRKAAQEKWTAWWKEHKDKLDLSKLESEHRTQGRTMVVLLDQGIVQELDAKGAVTWQLKDVQFPLDGQHLPNDQVLLAEHGANQVTIRNRKGETVRKIDVEGGPLVAQQRANGNIFIATDQQIIEVDDNDKKVFEYRRPLETFRKALRLRNGDVAVVTSGQRYIRLSPDLKELRTFEADIRTNGGRIDVLPNGHVLIPLKDANRVVECDPEGNVVWEATAEEPISALRLPNGHTLVNTLNQRRAVELDAAAQEVWEYKNAESRVTRAWRR